MKIIRLALLAIAVASSHEARAHDGAGPHSHGSADPKPLSAIEGPRDERTPEEIAAMLDRIEERRERDADAREENRAPAR